MLPSKAVLDFMRFNFLRNDIRTSSCHFPVIKSAGSSAEKVLYIFGFLYIYFSEEINLSWLGHGGFGELRWDFISRCSLASYGKLLVCFGGNGRKPTGRLEHVTPQRKQGLRGSDTYPPPRHTISFTMGSKWISNLSPCGSSILSLSWLKNFLKNLSRQYWTFFLSAMWILFCFLYTDIPSYFSLEEQPKRGGGGSCIHMPIV